MEPQLN